METPLVFFFRYCKFILDIKVKFMYEIQQLHVLIQSVLYRINKSLQYHIIHNVIYNHIVDELHLLYIELNKFPNKLSFEYIKKHKIISIMIIISKIKYKLVEIIQLNGCKYIDDIICISFNLNKKDSNDKLPKHLSFYNKYFNPLSFKIYEPTMEDGSQLKSIKNYYDQNEIVCMRLNDISNKILIQNIFGSKLIIPVQNKVIVVHGYFKNDIFQTYKKDPFLEKKINTVSKMISQLNNVPKYFRDNYIDVYTIIDWINFSSQECVNQLHKDYIEYKKNKQKSISELIKIFSNCCTVKQRSMIMVFLLKDNDLELNFIANVLYDLIKNDKTTDISNQLHSSLPIKMQQKLKYINQNIENMTKEISENYSEEQIPIENRIFLMKVPKYVKSKAYDKLKEINTSKNGESNVKAQQYLDGLLTIPFGTYKMEPILSFFKNFSTEIKIELDILLSYLDKINGSVELDFLKEETQILLQSKLTYKNIDMYFSKIKDRYNTISSVLSDITNNNHINDYIFKKFSKLQLQELLLFYKKPKLGKKKELQDRIINTIPTKLIHKYIFKDKSLENMFNTNTHFQKIKKYDEQWNTFKLKHTKYLDYVTNTLDKAVYSMKDAKNQIKRIIAQWVTGENKGYVFGFEGPAGTGKTTLAKKGIAKCLVDEDGISRPFIFIALGGSSNGSTLEGHNYTYVGSTWGRIVDALIESKCMNPIIYIDELDKISKTEHGKELVGILIHITDSSQNKEFMDKYFSSIKIDISKCLIIFSYNDPNNIDKILLDRIHRIKTKTLSKFDKINIAKNYLCHEILDTVGFHYNDIIISDNTYEYIIENYTAEEGVRKLKEHLYEIIRDINLKYLSNHKNITFPFEVTNDFIDNIFRDKHKIILTKPISTPQIGIINGLYASSVGRGGITLIECYKYPSDTRLSLELTGQQGDIMKESMKVSKTVAWNLLTDEQRNDLSNSIKYGLHIHCPEAAQPKDGPSAGVAITIAIFSLLTQKKIDNTVAITGEIDLNGHVYAIGGLESKLEGAKQCGIKTVLIPSDNKSHFDKIEYQVENDNFRVIYISSIMDAIKYVFI